MVTSKYMLKYIHSKRGIKIRNDYLERNYDRVRAYHRAYAKKRRIECKQNGICIKCFKSKADTGVFCRRCSDVMKLAIAKYNKKKNDKEKERKEE